MYHSNLASIFYKIIINGRFFCQIVNLWEHLGKNVFPFVEVERCG